MRNNILDYNTIHFLFNPYPNSFAQKGKDYKTQTLLPFTLWGRGWGLVWRAKIFSITVFLLIPFLAKSQNITGKVMEKDVEGNTSALISANIVWRGTTQGTLTDLEGNFSISSQGILDKTLVISYVGYQSDTISVQEGETLEVFLKPQELEGVEITADKSLNTDVQQIETLSNHDLRKAACCNLSESFETNASVDVSFSDAVSGTKKIRMLGLDGVYAQIMTENIPAVRGLASRSGLQFIPGAWMSAIDINKGAGSVVNGYESITGQINVTYAPMERGEKALLNLYGNQAGRMEGNFNWRHSLSERWHTSLLLHGSLQNDSPDGNNDGFRDIPAFQMVNVLNRWHYDGRNMNWHGGVNFLYDDRLGGQNNFGRNTPFSTQEAYGVGQVNRRVQVWSKLGLLPENHFNQSWAIMTSVLQHQHEAFWGVRKYQATQNYAMGQLIYQNELNEKNILKAGASLVIDAYEEDLQNVESSQSLYKNYREEWISGVFAEHTWKPSEEWNMVTGVRMDFHNLYGNFISPRLHLKYSPSSSTSIRLSGGRGFRVANVLVENGNYLASSRVLNIQNNLQPELAWNYGLSFSQEFYLNSNKGTLVIDYFRTDFENQVVMDLDSSPDALSFYNLNGTAFANSFQANVSYELFERFDVNLAYKYYDVRTTIDGKLRETPFIPKDRVFVNLAYSTHFDIWQFDFTTQWLGRQRLPNAQEASQDMYSPDYFLFNAQITKRFKGGWEVYVGGENLGNFMQPNPILNFENPFGNDFDAGIVYAPIMGRMIYWGVRWEID